MTRFLAAASLALAAFLMLAAPARAAEPQISKSDSAPEKVQAPLKLVLSAPLGAEQAKRDGRAVANALSAAMNRPVEFEVVAPGDLPALLANGTADIGWLTALEYIAAAKASDGKVQPVVKALHAGLPFYRSVIFTNKKNKTLLTPADLKGKKLAFVADTSSAGYVIPFQMLLRAGLTAEEIKANGSFLGDHASVCKAVLDGTADAGATISNDKAGAAIAGCSETLGAQVSELKVLAISDPIPNDVFALKAGATAEDFASLRSALMDLSKSNAGKKTLADHLHADGFTPVEDSEFAPLRDSLR